MSFCEEMSSDRPTSLILLGAESVQSLAAIDELRDSFSEIMTISSERVSYGRYTSRVDKKIYCPEEEQLLGIIKDNISDQPAIILPLVDSSAFYISEHAEKLSGLGVRSLTLPKGLLDASTDKFQLASVLESKDLSRLDSIDASDVVPGKLDYPVVAKPKFGAGARGIKICHTSRELDWFLDSLRVPRDKYYVQRFISPSRQFKVTGAVRGGHVISSAALEKIRYFPTQAGSSTLCTSVMPADYESDLLGLFSKVAEITQWEGMLDLDVISDPYLNETNVLEINPRIPACYAHYQKNGHRLLRGLLSGQDESLPLITEKMTQYVSLDVMRCFDDGGFLRSLKQWLSCLLDKDVNTYEFFRGDVTGAIGGFIGQIVRLRRTLRSKNSIAG